MHVRIKQSKGFTLVEILVVLGVMGILATIVFSSLATARENARDKERMSDVGQIQLALKVYQQGNGNLPAVGMICDSCSVDPDDANGAVQNFVGELEDPRHDGTTYFYEFTSTATSTAVCANRLEQTGASYCQPIQ